MIAHVQTADGLAVVDLEDETVLELDPARTIEPAARPGALAPTRVDAAAAGSTIIAVVDTKPPLMVSHDAGRTWRDSGRGLPAGSRRRDLRRRPRRRALRRPEQALSLARRRPVLGSLATRAAGDPGGCALEPELAAGDDHRRAAHLDPLDLLGAPVHARVELRGAADLDALRDLDLVAERDPPVPREMQGERPAAEPVAGSSAIPPPGTNIRVFQLCPRAGDAVHAEHLVDVAESRARSGFSAATSASEPSVTNTWCSPLS